MKTITTAVILDILARMTEVERQAFFDKLFDIYCRHCGGKHREGSTCQCWNDE